MEIGRNWNSNYLNLIYFYEFFNEVVFKKLKEQVFCLILASNFNSRKACYRRIVSDFMSKFEKENADGPISEIK
jgi:hypothetical protein